MTSTTGTLKILGYCRVSTQEQVTEGMSLDSQEHRIRSWAEAMGATAVDIIRDQGISGGKLLAERPGGRRIAKAMDARRPEADAVVVVRMDRLGRDAAEQISLLKRFRSGRVGVVAIAQSIDLATPHGRAMAQISAVFGELERALIGERTADGLSELRRQGRPWNHPPFGYTTSADADGTMRLIPDADEQATLARLVELRSQGLGYLKVAGALNAEGRSTKLGGPWQAMSVRNIFLREAQPAS
jgi:DNA invertase Pin-like site-specific DNA recombinase